MAGTGGFRIGILIQILYNMNWKEYFNLSEIIGYFFRKKDPNASSYMKMMYWANRIAITMFLVCLIVIIYRLFIR